jgi:glycosyltransferase involved in cell wall biosynthesis
VRIGVIARMDNTGLGNQTRELVKMLNPTKVLVINSVGFNNNKQHPEWYHAYEHETSAGFMNVNQVKSFLHDLDVVLTCETFYNQEFTTLAKRMGVRTVLQYNYEFLEYLVKRDLPLPTILLAPSPWELDTVEDLFGRKTKVRHLPPPVDVSLFSKAREINLSKTHNRVLHIAGKVASKDRNGTESVIEMLGHSNKDYELVIKTQGPIATKCKDSRLTIDVANVEDMSSLYVGFDLMILPRRYGGLCLPLNEALVSALPVFMTDISPNNQILPKEWLARSSRIGTLKTRASLNVYSADPRRLGGMVDEYMSDDGKSRDKQMALDLGLKMFSPDILRDKYLEIMA